MKKRQDFLGKITEKFSSYIKSKKVVENTKEVSPLLRPVNEIEELGLDDNSRDYCILYNIMQRRKHSFSKIYVDKD